MSNVEIEQRIKYLVEHGGLYDDPLDDIRRCLRIQRILLALVAAALILEVVIALTR